MSKRGKRYRGAFQSLARRIDLEPTFLETLFPTLGTLNTRAAQISLFGTACTNVRQRKHRHPVTGTRMPGPVKYSEARMFAPSCYLSVVGPRSYRRPPIFLTHRRRAENLSTRLLTVDVSTRSTSTATIRGWPAFAGSRFIRPSRFFSGVRRTVPQSRAMSCVV